MGAMRIVVFDIDDTLYLERDYVFSGFHAVAQQLASLTRVNATTLYEYMIQKFNNEGRQHVFDNLLQEFPRIRRACTKAQLLEVYRSHCPQIKILDGLDRLLNGLKTANATLAIVSDGRLVSQQRKVQALQLARWFDIIVLTDKWGKHFWKPHRRGFETIEQYTGARGEQLVYIADNPSKDFIAPNSLGWMTVRLRLPGQLYEEAEAECAEAQANYTAHSIAELGLLLLQFGDMSLEQG
jgi:putative hydrolase of the HAD superfamily